jgi:hypothetical protein
MMLLTGYKSKKEMKETAIGKPLKYRETSIFGAEFKANGTFVAAHRPAVTGLAGREFFAKITMENGLIKKVE